MLSYAFVIFYCKIFFRAENRFFIFCWTRIRAVFGKLVVTLPLRPLRPGQWSIPIISLIKNFWLFCPFTLLSWSCHVGFGFLILGVCTFLLVHFYDKLFRYVTTINFKHGPSKKCSFKRGRYEKS